MKPIAVRLVPHDPAWAARAQTEIARIMAAVPALVGIEHIGSTAIPGIPAKPILDLLGTGTSLAALEASRAVFATLGYAWHGEYGLAGRRYLTSDDPETGKRRVQLHCYARGDPGLARHVAFRDLLRRDAALAAEYGAMKQRCSQRHPEDDHAYSDCKDAWIKRVEALALTAG